VNDAEDRRNARIAKMGDLALIDLLLAAGTDGMNTAERTAFADMRTWLADTFGHAIEGRRLKPKQRSWAEEAARRIVPLDSRDVPRGKEVEKPAVLKDLPKVPPGRAPRG